MTRKRFGQHFLHEQGVIQRMLALLAAKAGDAFVEIGPGQGALTYPLCAAIHELTVIEIDRDLAARLRSTAPPGLTVMAADALKVDYAALAAQAGQPLRLVGNLPYNISSPLLFALLAVPEAIHDMHFMLQKEVVERRTAGPGSRTYGRLGVAVAARATSTHLFNVSLCAFVPRPRVMSAVVRVEPTPPALSTHDWHVFDHLVTAAFSMSRKTLRNALS